MNKFLNKLYWEVQELKQDYLYDMQEAMKDVNNAGNWQTLQESAYEALADAGMNYKITGKVLDKLPDLETLAEAERLVEELPHSEARSDMLREISLIKKAEEYEAGQEEIKAMREDVYRIAKDESEEVREQMYSLYDRVKKFCDDKTDAFQWLEMMGTHAAMRLFYKLH